MLKRLSVLAIVSFWTLGFAPASYPDLLNSQTASYYASGEVTANGESFDPNGLTAAHRKLPFGTIVNVRNLSNNKEIMVRINDRGPYIDGRALDLSRGAAKELDMLDSGLAEVVISVVQVAPPRTKSWRR